MTNSAGGGPSDPLGPVGPPGMDRVPAGREIDAADVIEGAEAAAEAAPAEAASATSGTDAIAEALGAGRIDADEARAQLIEEAVRAQLPAGADPALVEEIRAELEALLADDPTLRSLLG